MPKSKTKPPRAKRKEKVIVFPVASVGPCRNALRPGYKCESFDAELANGLCQECWDRSTDESPTPRPK